MNRKHSTNRPYTPNATRMSDQTTLRVDVVDMLGEGMDAVRFAIRNNNNMSRANATILIEYRPQGDRFYSFVEQVARSVLMTEGTISVLRLWAHAYVDDAHHPLGGAILGDKPFTIQDVRSRPEIFANLKPYFSSHPATRFEFRGCGVANFAGLDLMKELARLWGIRVHAAKENQATGMYWDGPVEEALPDGTLRLIGGVPFDSPF